MSVRDKVEQALKDLGNTSDEVAAKLLSARCLGERNRIYKCPVAKYVAALTKEDGARSVAASGFGCLIVQYPSAPKDGYLLKEERIDLPQPVREFVRRFDSGAYPELDWNPEATGGYL